MDKLSQTLDQVKLRMPSVRQRGEEATKQAMILPILDALGYDIWNPSEVCPEYEADTVTKKLGQKEKVDFAILTNGSARIFIEVKALDINLDGHEGQLARYFNAVPVARLGVLTNGVEWRFFTDTKEVNIMDSKPFLKVNLENTSEAHEVLSKFHKQVFSADTVRDFATESLYTDKIAAFLRSELDLRDRDPSEYFIRWVLKSENMYEGIVNNTTLERFKSLTKRAVTQVMREIVRRSLALLDTAVTEPEQQQQASQSVQLALPIPDQASKVVTTASELRYYGAIQGIFNTAGYPNRVIWDSSTKKEVPVVLAYKDCSTYFMIYVNKPQNWVARINVESKTPWIAFNIASEEKFINLAANKNLNKLPATNIATHRVELPDLENINKLTDLLISSIEDYLQN
jgi:hypothetical protein